MSNTPLEHQTLTFLHDVLNCRALSVREALIDGYGGPQMDLADSMKKLSSEPFALDQMNLFIHERLAAHHDLMSHNLRTWLHAKEVALLRPKG